MRGLVLTPPVRRFTCPSCGWQMVNRDPRVTTEFHECPQQRGAYVPLVEGDLAGERHVVIEREDYVGAEKGIRFDGEGMAVMAVRTERPDGSFDCAVFAPCATGTIVRNR